jgi:hypothetical protein
MITRGRLCVEKSLAVNKEKGRQINSLKAVGTWMQNGELGLQKKEVGYGTTHGVKSSILL